MTADPQPSVLGARRPVRLGTRPISPAWAAVALSGLWLLGACGETPAPAGDAAAPTASEGPAPAALPRLALAYVPGQAPTERRIAAAQRAVRQHPEAIEAYTTLTTALLQRRRETSNAVYATYAQDVLQAAAQRADDDPQVQLLTTMMLLEQHRFSDAAAKASALTRALPNDPTPHLLLGDARLELGDDEAAADAFQAAMNLRPDLRSYNRAAHMRWLYGDFDGAREIMDLAIDSGSARDPEGQAWCFADLGTMYLSRGDTRRAEAAAARALALLPDYVPALVVRARAAAAETRWDDAIDTLHAAVERRPAVEDLLMLSEWLTLTGKPDQAAVRRAQAERLAEDDPRPLAHFLSRHDQAPQEALRLARAERKARSNRAAYDTLALALLRNGRLDEATQAIDKALTMGTPDAATLLHAAMIQAANGKPSLAKVTLQRALTDNPHVDARLVSELNVALGDA